jgi:tRNA pseudouridine55 synthase
MKRWQRIRKCSPDGKNDGDDCGDMALSNRRRQKGRAVNGILVLDKPAGLSSNAALQEVKRLFNASKAGHTGSLDPLATGVLPLCLGEATKISQFLLESDKEYLTTIMLGIRTDTGDSEGIEIEKSDASVVDLKEIGKVLNDFVGEISQLPPMYSALKHDGVPLYKLARQGVEVKRESRPITLHKIDLLGFQNGIIEIQVACSKGTYIRTLADDIGQKLGCGAHVTGLRRLKAGVFSAAECVSLPQLRALKETSGPGDYTALDALLLEMDLAVQHFPEVVLPRISANCVRQGQAVLVSHLPADGLVRLYEGTTFIGIGSILDDGRVAPRRIIVDHEGFTQ